MAAYRPSFEFLSLSLWIHHIPVHTAAVRKCCSNPLNTAMMATTARAPQMFRPILFNIFSILCDCYWFAVITRAVPSGYLRAFLKSFEHRDGILRHEWCSSLNIRQTPLDVGQSRELPLMKNGQVPQLPGISVKGVLLIVTIFERGDDVTFVDCPQGPAMLEHIVYVFLESEQLDGSLPCAGAGHLMGLVCP